MNTRLRKAHLLTWGLLLIIIPTFMILVIKDLNFSDQYTQLNANNYKKKKALVSSENEFIKVSIFKNEIAYQLNVALKTPLQSPSTVLYNGSNETIGQLQGVGIYNFKLNLPIKKVYLKDDIKHTIITELNLQWD